MSEDAPQSTRRHGWLQVLAEGLVIGAVLGALLGVVWWLVTPPEKWLVTEQGVVPQDPGGDAWFASDGWFLLLGAAGGVVLALVLCRRNRRLPVATVLATLLGTAVMSLAMWSLGGVLGPTDPNQLIGTMESGTVLEGSLGIRATAVLLSPTLAALVVLAVALSMGQADGEQDAAGTLPYPVETPH